MSAGSGQLAVDLGGHEVQFYGGDRDLAISAGGYLAGGVAAGDMVVVVATPPHRRAFGAELRAAGADTGAAPASGRLLMLDAAGSLRGFRDGGRLDHGRFEAAVGGLVRRVASAGRPVRLYAEMVAVLWDAGQAALALELEELWNDLGSRFPFWLLCGYPARLAADGASIAEVGAVCRLHTGVAGPRRVSRGRRRSPARAPRRRSASRVSRKRRGLPGASWPACCGRGVIRR